MSLSHLEWDRVVDLATGETKTEPGKEQIKKLLGAEHWAKSVEEANRLQNEIQEIIPLLDRSGLWGPLDELQEIEPCLKDLEKGMTLSAPQMFEIRKWIYGIESWGQFPIEEVSSPSLKRAISALMDPFSLMRVLDPLLDEEGEISEKASKELSRLFSRIRNLKKKVGEEIDGLISRYDREGVLQDRFGDLRDGRYVLPVRISSQSKVEGRVAGISVSQQTAYVEPKELESLNRDLLSCETELTQEIFRVLREASEKIRPFVSEIRDSVLVISYWDSIQARARLGRQYGGKPIHVVNDRSLSLLNTAHPLLWWSLPEKEIVKNSVSLESPSRTLLITGPNTGGKTVLLKTLGLAAICARTGFSFPGEGRLEIPFFDSIFLDLGDPQSIEEHLSSFSGHVLELKKIIEGVTSSSLVLLDELNSATDPQEGAALSRAFLEDILDRGDAESGAMIVATTHDPILKTLGVNDSRILNASMEFDEDEHKPTYRIQTGFPGRSRAIETAENLGIPKKIIEKARSFLGSDHQKIETILEGLETKRREVEKEGRRAQQERSEAENLKKDWENRVLKSSTDLIERSQRKLKQIVEEVQDEARRSLKRLEEVRSRKAAEKVIDGLKGQLGASLNSAQERMTSALQEEAPELKEVLSKIESPVQQDKGTLDVGDKIRVPKWKSLATILEKKGSKIKVVMEPMFGQSGSGLQVNLSLDDIEMLSPTEQKKFGNKGTEGEAKINIESHHASEFVKDELDLRGFRFEEAMQELERYLDHAYQDGKGEVTIIHGLGTGAIREGTRKFLEGLPYVKEFLDGGPGRGGTGATVVRFER